MSTKHLTPCSPFQTSAMSPLPFLLLLLLLSPSVLFAQDPPLPRELGRFDLPNAAFIEAYSATGDDDDISLYITTFNASERKKKDAFCEFP